jgi:hypothetical protein
MTAARLPSSIVLLSIDEARRRITHDRSLLDAAVQQAPGSLTDDYLVEGGPLGDFCESLHDLVAHVLMWDEINLAVLSEARDARAHWSLDTRWEHPEVGRMLNVGGVVAGREIPSDLLLHRFASVRTALLDELGTLSDEQWSSPAAVEHDQAGSLGGLMQYAMTVPNRQPFWHAAIHLGLAQDLT